MEPRQHFQEELDALYLRILRLGAMVEEALNKSVTALSTRDTDLAAAVVSGDDEIDAIAIEDEVIRIIAMEQPVATDLRELITATKLVTGLERIGDHARHIARVVSSIPTEVIVTALPSIKTIAEVGTGMVHDSLTAFLEQNAELAREVAERDDRIDSIHKIPYRELIQLMTEHPEWIVHGVDLMFLNRFLERLGDHVTNMCEWVVFAKTGDHVELNK
jgi:phosphate transport system protein